jgi:AraC-like DNA-binding protein
MSGDPLTAALTEVLAPMVRRAVVDALAEHEPAERPPALLDGAGLARELGCSTRQVSRLVGEGLPHVLVGDARRYRLEQVLSWLDRRSRTEVDHA